MNMINKKLLLIGTMITLIVCASGYPFVGGHSSTPRPMTIKQTNLDEMLGLTGKMVEITIPGVYRTIPVRGKVLSETKETLVIDKVEYGYMTTTPAESRMTKLTGVVTINKGLILYYRVFTNGTTLEDIRDHNTSGFEVFLALIAIVSIIAIKRRR